MRKRIPVICLGALLLPLPGAAHKPAFEVTSVKVNNSGSGGGSMGPKGESFVATNWTLRGLLMYAYAPASGSLLNAQVIGGPEWATTDHFDVEGKPRGPQMKAMLQSLLEDRFQLKIRRETRDLPVYNLVPARKGPKLSDDQTPPNPRDAFITFASQGSPLSTLPRGAMRIVTGPEITTLNGTAVSIASIVSMLQGQSDRIIIDKSGVTGLIDVNLDFRQDLAPAAGVAQSATLFTALQEIGLKLEPAKAPLEVLVIEGVQRPSEN